MKSVLRLTSIATAIIISGQLIGCSGSSNNNTSSSDAGTTGGTLATGGTSATNGTHTGGVHATGGASSATGGSSSNGGSANAGTSSVGGSSVATGGSSTAGGNSATGGKSTAGGSSATGGMTSAGGSSATGGKSAAGGSSATGGSSTAGGVSATGGKSAAGGNSAAGGLSTAGGVSSTGGSSAAATGGTSSTGGTSALLPEAALLYADSPDCLTCAQTSCSNYLDNAAINTGTGYGSCQTVTGSANGSAFDSANEPFAVTAWAGDPYPVTSDDYNGSPGNGFTLTPFQYCMDLLTCLVQSQCDQGLLVACFCGDASGTDCINPNNFPGGCADPTNSTTTKGCAKAATGPIDGKCVAEEENALDTNTVSSIPTAFADVTLPGGPPNELVNCLASHCTTQCSM